MTKKNRPKAPQRRTPATPVPIPPQLAGLLALLEPPDADRSAEVRRALTAARTALRDALAEDVDERVATFIGEEAARGPWKALHQFIDGLDEHNHQFTAGDYVNIYSLPALLMGVGADVRLPARGRGCAMTLRSTRQTASPPAVGGPACPSPAHTASKAEDAMKAPAFDHAAALKIVDRTEGGLYRALRLLDMLDAIARLCEEPDNEVSKEDLQSIYRGLTLVIERLHQDISAANQGVAELWHMVRDGDKPGGAR
jgi:hypothetical protein